MKVTNDDLDFDPSEFSTGIHLIWQQLQGMLYRRALMLKRASSMWTRMLATYVVGLEIITFRGLLSVMTVLITIL
jgi:hypothetical protein